MPTDARTQPHIAALRHTQDRLASLAASMDAADPDRPSMAADWTIAQVFSHLGSGAEIGRDWLRSAVAHAEPMPRERMQEIWDNWNHRPASAQVTTAVRANEEYVAAYEALSLDELRQAHIVLFGGVLDLDGIGLARTRLNEAAMHTWDVDAALNPGACVLSDAVHLLVDQLAGNTWLAKGQPKEFTVTVATSDPERHFTVVGGPDRHEITGGTPASTPNPAEGGPSSAVGTLRVPAELFLRLAYGRLRDRDLAALDLDAPSVTVADLTATFPGI